MEGVCFGLGNYDVYFGDCNSGRVCWRLRLALRTGTVMLMVPAAVINTLRLLKMGRVAVFSEGCYWTVVMSGDKWEWKGGRTWQAIVPWKDRPGFNQLTVFIPLTGLALRPCPLLASHSSHLALSLGCFRAAYSSHSRPW